MNEAPILEVKNLNIEFHDHLIPETVVHGLNLEVYQGETLGIVGESGSGKTMCALAIAGLLNRKDMKKSGEILFGGYDLLSCPRQILRGFQGKDIGIVFQEPLPSLNPSMRIGKQMEEPLILHTKLKHNERYEKVLRALADAELANPEDICRKYPHELSGGMCQRVMIAMAIVCEPKLLIADEVTTALDAATEEQIVALLRRLGRQKKMAMLFISHDLRIVRDLCDRVIVMREGFIVERGLAADVFAHPGHEYTRSLVAAML